MTAAHFAAVDVGPAGHDKSFRRDVDIAHYGHGRVACENDAFMHVAVPLRPDPDIKFGLLGAVSKTYEAAPISESRLSQGLSRYRDLGSGPCVVLIHGLFVNSSVWDRFGQLPHQYTTGRRHRHPLDRTTDRLPSEARREKWGHE